MAKMTDAERRAQVAQCSRDYRARMVQEGRCAYCGSVRGENDGGTKHRCPSCHAKQKAASAVYRNAHRGETDWSKYAPQKRAYKAAQREKQMAGENAFCAARGGIPTTPDTV